MLLLPADSIALRQVFAPLFSRCTWRHIPLLITGTILAPGQRMVSTALRAVGLGQVRTFQTYHRVLHHAAWSGLGVSRYLLGLLVATFAPTSPLVVGIDEGDPSVDMAPRSLPPESIEILCARATATPVKMTELRWICLHLLAPIPWAGYTWALPFLTALAPSERYTLRRHRRFKPITLWAHQLIRRRHIAGSRIGGSWSSAIAPTKPCSCWQPYAVWQPSSRVYAWMRICARQPPFGCQGKPGDRAW
jgi:hypothetical protein